LPCPLEQEVVGPAASHRASGTARASRRRAASA
jgi:hypothetical protein